jgi:prepilin-type processing-associated H-X9-DG protein
MRWRTVVATALRAPLAVGGNLGSGYPQCYSDWNMPHTDGRNNAFLDGHVKYLTDQVAKANAAALAGP